MARDPMRLLRTVRQHAVEQARQALAQCLRAETVAANRVQAIDDAAQRDREASLTEAEAHPFIEMFARRVQAAVEERQVAEEALAAARAASAEARAILVAARTAEEAVRTLITERAEAAEADASRREQHALDDMARSRFDSPLR